MQLKIDGEAVLEICYVVSCTGASVETAVSPWLRTELVECGESLDSDLVKQDVSPNASLTCVTEHPGFNPVCPQTWSLKMAGSKFKTKEK